MDIKGDVIAKAHADLVGNGIAGTVDFEELDMSVQRIVKIIVSVKADSTIFHPGQHGFHIHEKGVCEGDFTSAGGHFDPGPAGNSDPDVNHPFHAGDLPNLTIKEDGTGYMECISTRFTLSEGPLSIFDEDGASVMVHAHHDQETPGEHKSGLSGGPRMACGVIFRT